MGRPHKCSRGHLGESERDAEPEEGRAERQKNWALAKVTNNAAVPGADSFPWSADIPVLNLRSSRSGLSWLL